MTKTKAFLLTDATKLVSTFHTTLNAHTTGQSGHKEQYDVATRGRLYGMLGEAYGVSLALTSNPEVLGQLCVNYGIEAPGENDNPHSTVVRLLFGKKNKATNKWEGSRSAWKYSKGFRAAAALGWTAKDYAKKLDEYSYVVQKNGKEVTLKRHVALEAYDTAQHGNPQAVVTQQTAMAARAWMSKAVKPLASFQSNLVENPADLQLVGLVAQYDAKDGAWHIRAVNQPDHEKAWATVAKNTLSDFDKFVKNAAVSQAIANGQLPLEGDELMKALDKHNSEQDAANQLAAYSNRLVGLETDGDFVWPTVTKATGSKSPEDQDNSRLDATA